MHSGGHGAVRAADEEVTLGYHAPSLETGSGVADYAWRLAGELARHLDVRPGAARADIQLYHLGNNQLHWPIYRRALEEPGVIVLHDANLHHMHLGALERAEYVAEFTGQYGDWHRSLAERFWAERARSAADPAYYQYTMLRRAVERARAVIVHNEAAAAKVRRAGGVDAKVIPHFVPAAPAPDAWTVARLREKLGLTSGDFVAGVFGHLRESKRLAAILRAFKRARRQAGVLRLLICGGFTSRDHEAALAPMLAEPGVVVCGYQESEEDFWHHLWLADLCLNLRYPSCGESSGIAARMAAAGKALVVTEGAEWEGFPPGLLLGVDAGAAEEAMLVEYLIWGARNPRTINELGARLGEWARRANSLEKVAERLAGAIKNTQFPVS